MVIIRKFTKKRRALCLLLSIALLLSLPLFSCNTADQPITEDDNATVTIFRLKEDMPLGTKITSPKFEEVTVLAKQAAVGAVTDISTVVGKYSAVDLEAGDILIESDISEEKPNPPKVKVELEDNDFGFKDYNRIVVTEYVTASQGNDIADELRSLLSRAVYYNSVIYFPDGEYLISKPLVTSSLGTNSVALKFSANAVLKATDDWDKSQGAMIQLGGRDNSYDIDILGSNYFVEGGIIDGNGRADGISIECGREASIRNLTIVNTVTGLHFNNFGHVVDSDAENITIIGNGAPGSIGLRIEGSDSTFTNMRISNVQTGVQIHSPAHILRNIRVTYISNPRLDAVYTASFGFKSGDHRCWFDTCISDGFSTAFVLSYRGDTFQSCVATWDEVYGPQIAFSTAHKSFTSVIRSFVAHFTAPKEQCEFLVAPSGGSGAIYDPMFDENAVNSDAYKEYIRSSATK